MLTAALIATAVVAGAAGTWSPCGFSAIDTIGRGGRRFRTTFAACVAFTGGCVAGGVAAFGALAAIGGVLDAGTTAVAAATTAVAAAAALAEASGTRVVPQVRRQVPEPWRRALPLPATGALYGVLLGVGFATFVLTLGFWALAAIVFAQGDLVLGVAVGVAFGSGRALPVTALAAVARRPSGIAMIARLAERPGLLRGWRLTCAATLAWTAAAALA